MEVQHVSACTLHVPFGTIGLAGAKEIGCDTPKNPNVGLIPMFSLTIELGISDLRVRNQLPHVKAEPEEDH